MAIAKNIITVFFITISFVCKSADSNLQYNEFRNICQEKARKEGKEMTEFALLKNLCAYSTPRGITMMKFNSKNRNIRCETTAEFEELECKKMVFNPDETRQQLAILGTIKERIYGGGTYECKGILIFDYSESLKYTVYFNKEAHDIGYSKSGNRFAYMTDNGISSNLFIYRVGEVVYTLDKFHTIKNEIGPESSISCSDGAFCVNNVFDSEFPYQILSEQITHNKCGMQENVSDEEDPHVGPLLPDDDSWNF